MRKLCVIGLLATGIFGTSNSLAETRAPSGNADDDAALTAILEASEMAEIVEPDLDEHDWLLTRVLRHGFAHTPTTPSELPKLTSPFGYTPQRTPLSVRLERYHLEERLSSPPISHHGLNILSRGARFDIPIRDHALVDAYIDYFTGRGRAVFGRWLGRLDRYSPLIVPLLAEAGLPKDTIYLAMIESGFNPKAYSSAGASGFWQFMPATGRLFNLRQNFWIDERRDFIKATHSAIRYLKKLHSQFDDWHLSWAGYNAGGGRIRRALAKYEVEDYWTLIEHTGSLAKETRHYVPKLIAAAIIAKNRVYYGFDDIKALPPLLFDSLQVKQATDLRVVAKKLTIDLKTLQELNPAWKHSVSPPNSRSMLRVPAGMGDGLGSWLSSIPASKRIEYATHKIRSGDTLSGIAHRYGTSTRAIRDFNKIRNDRTLRIGRTILIPAFASRSGVARTKRTSKKPKRTTASTSNPRQHHKVVRGETLWSIARRYNVTVTNLKRWNRRRSSRIRVGETLSIF